MSDELNAVVDTPKPGETADTKSTESESGIRFWSGMYIPVVVAMASTQHVKAALQGGWLAVVAGVGGTLFCFLLIPLLAPKREHDHGSSNDKP